MRMIRQCWFLAAAVFCATYCCVKAFSSPLHYSVQSFSNRIHTHHPSSLPKSCSGVLFASNNNGEQEPDEDEWRSIVAAFQMYKAAYGDLKVPIRFVVPAMPPWPESSWNLKLGQKVAAIRSTGKYVQNNEVRRRMLEKMGFQWRLRSKGKTMDGISFDQIYEALKAYRKYQQPETPFLSVKRNFVVPDCDPWPESIRGLPLGKLLPTVRTKPYLKANPQAEQLLSEIGFQFDGKSAANDARFQKVYEALQQYKEIYGDLLVPQPFVVPPVQDWPEDTWGLRLGARVNAIRSQGTFVNTKPERRKMLDDLGFAWSPPTADGGKRRGRRKREEIEAMRASLFSAASASDSAADVSTAQASMESLFGQAFGQDPFFASGNMDAAKTAPTWGFENDGDMEAARAAEEAKRAAEEEYKPPKLLSETLKEAAEKAVSVGIVEYMTEDNRIKKGKREKQVPWFNDDFGDDFVFEDVVEALTFYKSIHSNFSGLVENDEYVVPSSSSSDLFDQDGEKLELFDTEASVRAAAAIAAFEEEGKAMESEDLISAEIKRMQEEIAPPAPLETEVAVEENLVTQEWPEENQVTTQEWPEHLAGMPLGSIVRRIRDGSLEVKHLPERKAQLDAIDFDWGDPKYFLEVPFEKAMCSMYAYYLVRGDMFVYEDFVMPDEDPWPKALAGYELGKTVTQIRELQNFIEAYHPDKLGLLRAIDFMWFPNLARPLDPNEDEMTPEMLLVIGLGHPSYAKMREIPMGLPEKILADGPFFESDNPKQWWRKWYNWDYVKDYWYEQGRRDNGFYLRSRGYNVLADEHEAKYGPGLFQQINETMMELEGGVEEKSEEECTELLRKLKYYREEMTDCTDLLPDDHTQLLEDLDEAMLSLMDEADEEALDDEEEEFFEEEEEEQTLDEAMEDGIDVQATTEENNELIEEEFNVEEELGLDNV